MTSQLESQLRNARLRARCCMPIWNAITDHADDVEVRVAKSNLLCDTCLSLLDECLRSAPAAPRLAPTGSTTDW